MFGKRWKLQSDSTAWVAAFILALLFSAPIAVARLNGIYLLTFEFELCVIYIPTIVLGIISARIHKVF